MSQSKAGLPCTLYTYCIQYAICYYYIFNKIIKSNGDNGDIQEKLGVSIMTGNRDKTVDNCDTVTAIPSRRYQTVSTYCPCSLPVYPLV